MTGRSLFTVVLKSLVSVADPTNQPTYLQCLPAYQSPNLPIYQSQITVSKETLCSVETVHYHTVYSYLIFTAIIIIILELFSYKLKKTRKKKENS